MYGSYCTLTPDAAGELSYDSRCFFAGVLGGVSFGKVCVRAWDEGIQGSSCVGRSSDSAASSETGFGLPSMAAEAASI